MPVRVPRPSRRVVQGQVDGSTVLFHLDDRRMHLLNETAAALWSALPSGAPFGVIAARVADRYGADPDVVGRDLDDLVGRFHSDGLVVDEPNQPDGQHRERVARLVPDESIPGWPEQGSFGALDATVRIETPDEELGEVVSAVLEPIRGPVAAKWAIRVLPVPGGRWDVLIRPGEAVTVGSRLAAVVRALGEVNAAAVESAVGRLVLHAGAVASPAGAVVLPAGPNHGKSTLTTALVRAGFGYLTDEAAMIDRDGRCVPYAKAIALDPGSFAVHPDLAPEPRRGLGASLDARAWHVPPGRVGAVSEPAPVVSIVFPRWRPGLATTLSRCTPCETLTQLLGESFDFAIGGQPVFDILRDLAVRVRAHRLVYSDVDDAVAVVSRLLEESGRATA